MIFQSPSEPLSQQLSVQTPRRCLREKGKRKRIKKDRKERSQVSPTCHEHEFKNIEQFFSSYGTEYFESKPAELVAKLLSQYRRAVHIKSILGEDQNVYKINNYQNCDQHATHYLALVNGLQNTRLERVGLKFRGLKLAIDFCRPKLREEGKRRALFFLRKGESVLLRKRREVWKDIDDFLKKLTNNFKENQQVGQLEKEILTLCKINTASDRAIADALARLELRNNLEAPISAPTSEFSINDEYISLLVMKNLRLCFEEDPLNLLNYFKAVEQRERNVHDDVAMVQVKNADELKDYLRSRKPRPGRGQQHSLRTCCSGCFSNHYEIYNPIESCNECGMRMHLYCQSIRGRCQRCRYVRKTVDEKSHTQSCSLCRRGFEKGLLVQGVARDGREEYVHTFCLLVHSQWRIQQQTLVQKIQEQGKEASACRFCQKQSCFYFTCPHCLKNSHGLCAYLAGCSFAMDSQGGISMSCCNSSQEQGRLSLERRFKLNYERMLYKKGGQFCNAIEGSR